MIFNRKQRDLLWMKETLPHISFKSVASHHGNLSEHQMCTLVSLPNAICAPSRLPLQNELWQIKLVISVIKVHLGWEIQHSGTAKLNFWIWSAYDRIHLRCLLSVPQEICQSNMFFWAHVIFFIPFMPQLDLTSNCIHLVPCLLRCWCRQAGWEIHYDVRRPVPEASPWPKPQRLGRTDWRRGNQLSDLSHLDTLFVLLSLSLHP